MFAKLKSVSALGWLMVVSVAANVLTAAMLIYIAAFGLEVSGGYVQILGDVTVTTGRKPLTVSIPR